MRLTKPFTPPEHKLDVETIRKGQVFYELEYGPEDCYYRTLAAAKAAKAHYDSPSKSYGIQKLKCIIPYGTARLERYGQLRSDMKTEVIRQYSETTPVRSNPDLLLSPVALWSRPHRSKALRCHPNQVAEFNEAAHARGETGVFYEPGTGDCLTSSRAARARETRARGQFDKDAGYGDYAGDSREYMDSVGVQRPGDADGPI